MPQFNVGETVLLVYLAALAGRRFRTGPAPIPGAATRTEEATVRHVLKAVGGGAAWCVFLCLVRRGGS
jgi:hypothetical protein